MFQTKVFSIFKIACVDGSLLNKSCPFLEVKRHFNSL